MKSSELIKALEEGKIVFRIHHSDSDCKEKVERIEIHDTFYFHVTGWGSIGGNASERIYDMMMNPENWSIE